MFRYHVVIAWLINAIALFVLPWVFPWVQSELPFTDVTVEAASSG